MRKAKASLIASVVIGLLAVSTAGVSTYAWFTAQINVNVSSSTSDSSSITVSRPDDLTGECLEYMGNTSNGYLTKGSETRFATVSASSFGTISNLKPGYKASYLMKVKGATAYKLTLTGFTPGSDSNLHIIGGSPNYSDTNVRISAAHGINIYCKSYTTENHANYLGWVEDTAELNSSTYDKFKYNGSMTSAVLNDDATATSASSFAYIYFTVTFDDHSPSFYTEYDKAGTGAKPLGYDGSGTRYFLQDDNGNSNCFKGLSFRITSLQIDIR